MVFGLPPQHVVAKMQPRGARPSFRADVRRSVSERVSGPCEAVIGPRQDGTDGLGTPLRRRSTPLGRDTRSVPRPTSGVGHRRASARRRGTTGIEPGRPVWRVRAALGPSRTGADTVRSSRGHEARQDSRRRQPHPRQRSHEDANGNPPAMDRRAFPPPRSIDRRPGSHPLPTIGRPAGQGRSPEDGDTPTKDPPGPARARSDAPPLFRPPRTAWSPVTATSRRPEFGDRTSPAPLAFESHADPATRMVDDRVGRFGRVPDRGPSLHDVSGRSPVGNEDAAASEVAMMSTAVGFLPPGQRKPRPSRALPRAAATHA